MQDFINAFKRLEKLCSEVYGQQHGVTQYIDDLEHTLLRSYGSSGGKPELERLKELRYMRNQMVHDADSDVHYTKADVQFLEDFYERIMNQTDPLALYRNKAKANKHVNMSRQNHSSVITRQISNEEKYSMNQENSMNQKVEKKNKNVALCVIGIVALICVAVAIAVIIICLKNAPKYKTNILREGGIYVTYQVKAGNPSREDMQDTIIKLKNRVEEFSVNAAVYQEGEDSIGIEIPGVQNVDKVLSQISRSGQLYFIREKDGNLRENYSKTEAGYVLNKSIEDLLSDGSIGLTGGDVSSASSGYQQDNMKNNEFIVSLSMTDEGTRKFLEMTREAYNNHATIAICFEGTILTAPYVEAIITDGHAVINAMKSIEEAEEIASAIRIGALKYELEQVDCKIFTSSGN